jgi:ketosteroid isomerase-like protein
MTQQDSAAIARAFFEAWNDRDYERGTSLIADDGELTEVATDESYRGPDGLREEYDKWGNAFPDGRVQIRNSFAAGDWATVECTFQGTNAGAFVGAAGAIPPTGRSLTFDFCTVSQVRDGRLVLARH